MRKCYECLHYEMLIKEKLPLLQGSIFAAEFELLKNQTNHTSFFNIYIIYIYYIVSRFDFKIIIYYIKLISKINRNQRQIPVN